MGTENGHKVIYSPTRQKVELNKKSIGILSDKLNTFLDEENLTQTLREDNAKEVRAKYNYSKDNEVFQGGPSFVLSHKEPYWNLFIAQGPRKSIEMQLNREGEIQDIQHNFDEKGYRTEIILGWLDSVFNSIRTAQDRDAFKWEIKY